MEKYKCYQSSNVSKKIVNIIHAVDGIKVNRVLPHPVRKCLSLCINVITVSALVDLEKCVNQTLCHPINSHKHTHKTRSK